MYRPTVRYGDIFRDYVDSLFKSTHLDRSQLLRAALFAAAHSREFRSILEKYKLSDVPLPCPEWSLTEEDCWKNQSYIPKPKEPEKPENIRVIKKGGIRYIANASPIG